MKKCVSGSSSVVVFGGVVLLVAAPLIACSVPVFRYALQRWAPNSYQAVVFYRSKLGKDQSAVCKKLIADAGKANLAVKTVDLNEDRSPWAPEFFTSGDLPRMVLLKPATGSGSSPPSSWPAENMVWSAPVDKASAAAIVDSPKRREISRLIRSGQSVVWVLLESGDAKKDAAAAALTKRTIAALVEKLKIVKPRSAAAQRDGAKLAKLRLAFSLVRVSRTDRAERMLVEMLLSSGKELCKASGPILFPVFGRGRVFTSLVDKDISPNNIGQAAAALTGPCSCQVKAKSASRIDLLISADWTTEAKPAPTSRPAPTKRPKR